MIKDYNLNFLWSFFLIYQFLIQIFIEILEVICGVVFPKNIIYLCQIIVHNFIYQKTHLKGYFSENRTLQMYWQFYQRIADINTE